MIRLDFLLYTGMQVIKPSQGGKEKCNGNQ